MTIFELTTIAVGIHIVLAWALAIHRGIKAKLGLKHLSVNGVFQPPVSILIPAWRERGMLEKCIQALQKITYPNWEAILLAGGPDGTYETALQSTAGDNRFRVLERGPEPKNAVLTRGVGWAQHETLVLLDADCIVEPSWLDALVAPLSLGASVSVGERLPIRKTWITLSEQMQNIQAYQIQGGRYIQGDRSVAFSRDVLDRIGGLPTHTYGREDWDLGIKWIDAGVRIAYTEKARLWTDRPATLREYWRNEVRWRRTHLAGLWEHRSIISRHPVWGFTQIYFYCFSVLLCLAASIMGMVAIRFPFTLKVILPTFVLTLIWICGRRAALAGEVAAYTGEKMWLKGAHAPSILILVSIPASVVALLLARRGVPFDYKGPRAKYAT